jgi:hypothetical protein
MPLYQSDRRLSGLQNQSGRRREEIYLLSSPGLELRPLGHPARSQSVYRLRYLGSAYEYSKGRLAESIFRAEGKVLSKNFDCDFFGLYHPVNLYILTQPLYSSSLVSRDSDFVVV